MRTAVSLASPQASYGGCRWRRIRPSRRHCTTHGARVLRRAARVLLAVALMTMLAAPGASAQSAPQLSRSEAVQTVGVYEAAAADAETATATPATQAALPLDVPADPSDGVAIGIGDRVVRVFPDDEAARGDGVAMADGTRIYPGASPEISTVVDPVATGAQIATVALDASGDWQSYR